MERFSPAADARPGAPLFVASRLPDRLPRRPLGALSDFVVLSLPRALREMRRDRDRFAPCVAALDAAIAQAPAAEGVPAADRTLACLDLALLQQACDHAGIAVPAPAAERLQALAATAGRMPTFLYEDCVLHNPLDGDPRLFCDEAVGASERDFLVAHLHIEAHLARALACAERIAASADALPGARRARLCDALAQHGSTLEDALAGTEHAFRTLRAMPAADFAVFRPYYTPSPRTGLPGPSGRFSAAVFLFRFAIEGVTLLRRRPDIAADLRQSHALYPQAHQAQLHEWLDAADCAPGSRLPARQRGLARLALQPWTQSTPLPGLVQRARATMDLCTAMHLGLARRYIAAYAACAAGPDGAGARQA